MGISIIKAKVKEIFSFELIDVEDVIHKKGNYIYLASTTKVDPLDTKYTFEISIIGDSLVGSNVSETYLETALKEIHNYELENSKNMEVSSKLIKEEELLGYVISLSIIDKTR